MQLLPMTITNSSKVQIKNEVEQMPEGWMVQEDLKKLKGQLDRSHKLTKGTNTMLLH